MLNEKGGEQIAEKACESYRRQRAQIAKHEINLNTRKTFLTRTVVIHCNWLFTVVVVPCSESTQDLRELSLGDPA